VDSYISKQFLCTRLEGLMSDNGTPATAVGTKKKYGAKRKSRIKLICARVIEILEQEKTEGGWPETPEEGWGGAGPGNGVH